MNCTSVVKSLLGASNGIQIAHFFKLTMKWQSLNSTPRASLGLSWGWWLPKKWTQKISLTFETFPFTNRSALKVTFCHKKLTFIVTILFSFLGVADCGCFRMFGHMSWSLGQSVGCSSRFVLRRLYWTIDCGCFPSVHSIPSRKVGCCLVWTQSSLLGMQHWSFR